MGKRRSCPICGSRQWHKEPSSGLIACSEGHVLQNYRNEIKEMEEMGAHAVKKRALKSQHNKTGRKSRAKRDQYHGAKGRHHTFLCQQHILRLQVRALMRMWDLPPEFEVICRELWAMHLSLLPNPPDEQEGEKSGEATMDAEGRVSDSDDEDEDEDVADSEIERLMRENSEISSSDEEEDGDDDRPATIIPKKSRSISEGVVSTLAVLVIACWTLRIPVIYRDFIRIVESYELPYLEPVRLLPKSLAIHLNASNRYTLSPNHAPTALTLHKLASRLSRRMHSTYNVSTPAANGAPILWRVVKSLGGTPVLYDLSKKLARILKLPLTLDVSLAPGLVQIKRRDPEIQKYDSMPPEEALMATCIIVLKMVYGLDGTAREPRTEDDPACALARKDEFLALLKQKTEDDRKSREAVFDSHNAMTVEDLDEDTLDEYIGFCERAMLGRVDADEDAMLSRFFPVERRGPAGCVLAEEGRAGGGLNGTRAGDSLPRPGEKYVIWHSKDVGGTVEAEYAGVVRRGSEVVGVSDEQLGRTVETFERRVARWRIRNQRMS